MDPISVLTGAGVVAGSLLVYFAAKKGVPATLVWLKAKWSAGAAELVNLKGDVADAHAMIAALETRLQADLDRVKDQVSGIVGPVSALQTDVNALKAKVGA